MFCGTLVFSRWTWMVYKTNRMSVLSLQRSKRLLEKQGFKVAIVERWNQYAHIRQDLYGVADLIALKEDRNGTTYVQCTGEDMQIHLEKILSNTVMPTLLRSGNSFFLWAWRKRGARGKRKLWELTEIE